MTDEAKTEEKKTRKPLVGMALEMDVMKKIGAQLDRLPKDGGGAGRIIVFVQDYVKQPAPGLTITGTKEEDLL